MSKTFTPKWLEAHRVDLPPVDRRDIVGLTHVMTEIASVVGRLDDTEAARAIGAVLPRGVLFHGPAGTGKTLTARFLAGTLGPDVPMFEVSSDELTAPLLRALFRHLAMAYPRSVLYLDEIDQWAMTRDAVPYHSSSTRLVLTAALAALDGLVPTAGPIVIASSNRPPRSLDGALVRSGRLGIHIRFDLPDEAERAELFRRMLSGRPVDADIDFDRLARLSRDLSPAAIRGLVDDAAGLALARGGRTIGPDDLVEAIRRNGSIEPAEGLQDPERRRRTAVHEAGHVAVAIRLRGAAWIYAVRITAFGGSTETGHDRSLQQVMTDDAVRDNMIIGMAGFAAERALLGEPSLTSESDMNAVTRLAMSRLASGVDPTFPPISFDALNPFVSQDLMRAAGTALAERLEAARGNAEAIVASATGAIERFARVLDEAGELVGSELTSAIEAAGFVGPEAVA